MREGRTGRVLVTGAAGFVGRKLAAVLSDRGWRVTGLDRVRPAGEMGSFAEVWTADLLDLAATSERAGDAVFDAVVHLAGLVPTGAAPCRELFTINAGGTAAVLQYLVRPGTHVVLFSTGLVYGNQTGPFVETMPCATLDPYAQSKLAAEAIVQAWSRGTHSPASILRPSVLYGRDAPAGMLLVSLMETLRRGEAFATTSGEQRRDFLHIDDAAEAVALLLERRTEGTWNLASGEDRTVRETVELAGAITGRSGLLRIGARPYRTGEVFDYRLDAGALRRALGWQPRISLNEGLKQLWKENG